jgi:hypothetical protein
VTPSLRAANRCADALGVKSEMEAATMPGQVERRRGGGRRTRATRPWDGLFGRRRRSAGRRAGEQERVYIDRYRGGDVTLVLAVFVLNLLDAFFTLRWLGLGGSEGNPLMKSVVESDDLLFLAQKCFVVAVCLVVLVIHRNFRFARLGLWALFSVYGALLVYHVFLQTFATPIPAAAW